MDKENLLVLIPIIFAIVALLLSSNFLQEENFLMQTTGGVTEVENWEDLHNTRKDLNDNYVLVNDLTPNTAGYEEFASQNANGGDGWNPIGGYRTHKSFSGKFDGNGHTISGLYISRGNSEYVGLFSWVEGVVVDVGLENAYVRGDRYAGVLAGKFNGTANRCFVKGSNVGTSEFNGGLLVGVAGASGADISNCYTTGEVHSTWYVGGLSSYSGSIKNSYSLLEVVRWWNRAGSIIGCSGTVEESFYHEDGSGEGTMLSPSEFRSVSTFDNAGWDITSIENEADDSHVWNMVENETRPRLYWEFNEKGDNDLLNWKYAVFGFVFLVVSFVIIVSVRNE